MATYKVKKGDTLWAIAQQYGMTVADLAKASGITNPDMIYIGQSITVPEPKKAETPVVSTPTVKQPIPNRNTMTPEDYEVAMDNYANKIPNAPDPLAYQPLPKAPAPVAPPVVENDYRTTPLVDPNRDGDISGVKEFPYLRPSDNQKEQSMDVAFGINNGFEGDNSIGIDTGFKGDDAFGIAEKPKTTNDGEIRKEIIDNINTSGTPTPTTTPTGTVTGPSYGSYEYSRQPEVDALIDKILNRKPFSYDLGQDMQYQALRDQYQTEGNLAMRDTMGNASGLSGGYGNSYASTAGNQAYQQSLGQLNKQVPELYRSALSKYNSDSDDMHKTLGALDQENYREQSQFRDDYGMWKDEQSRNDTLDRQAVIDAQTKWDQDFKQEGRVNEQAQLEFKNQLLTLETLMGGKPSEADMTKLDKMAREQYEDGMTDEYIATMILNTYGQYDSFYDINGPFVGWMLPSGAMLGEVLAKMQGNSSGGSPSGGSSVTTPSKTNTRNSW